MFALDNITSNNGGSKGSQSLYESLEQDYSPQNLNDFQINFGLKVENVALDINGYDQDSVCIEAPGNCTEANLDVQYIMAVRKCELDMYIIIFFVNLYLHILLYWLIRLRKVFRQYIITITRTISCLHGRTIC